MKTTVFTVFVLSVCLSVGAQSRTAAPAAPVVHHNLNSSLLELQRVASATDKDIASLEIGKPKSNWKHLWLSNSSGKQQAQMAASLQRNLETAMPGLIHDVQNSRGSISKTFKLYNDLNVVHQTLELLVESMDAHAKNNASASLANEASAMNRIRQELAGYIQDVSASIETTGKSQYAWSSIPGQLPKKIIVDDNEPDPKPVRKKTIASR